MKLTAFTLAAATAFAPLAANAQQASNTTVTAAEVDRAAAPFCGAYSQETKNECIQHMPEATYAQVARRVVANRCGGFAVEATDLAKLGFKDAAVQRRYDASDCAIGVMMGTQDPTLQDEAQAYSLRQRALAASLVAVKAAVK